MKGATIVLLFILIFFAACTSPLQEILGKWKIEQQVINGKQRILNGKYGTQGQGTTFLAGSNFDITNSIHVIEFCSDGIINEYYDGVNYKDVVRTYRIEGDSIFCTFKTQETGEHLIPSKYSLESYKLTLTGNDSTYTIFERVNK